MGRTYPFLARARGGNPVDVAGGMGAGAAASLGAL